MKKKIKDYHEYLVESLHDPEEAEEYLNTALEENDPKYFLKALRNVVEALYGMTEFSRKTSVSRMSLYRMLSETGNPKWENVLDIIGKMGFRFTMKRAA